MSAMANTTPIVTTVTKTANKKKTSNEADAKLKANILDFCEEHYEDIFPDIMDKIRRDKRKEVHARLDFGENPRKSRRVREALKTQALGPCPQATQGNISSDFLENSNNDEIPPVFSPFYNNPYLKDMQAFYAKESPIPPPDPITLPIILTPSTVLPSLLFDP
nr:hypothetical protein [Tanacetum cinerariifolium]